MLDFEFKQVNGAGFLSLSGDLMSRPEDDIREALQVTLNNSEHLFIDMENVTGIDRLFLEQIETTNKVAAMSAKKLSIINLGIDCFKGKICKAKNN